MIGLSVSSCIREMSLGKVDPAKVEKIIARTAHQTPESWEKAIRRYREQHWYENPDEAERLVRQFLAEGKILQPRLTERRHPNVTNGIWVESEDKIVYDNC